MNVAVWPPAIRDRANTGYDGMLEKQTRPMGVMAECAI